VADPWVKLKKQVLCFPLHKSSEYRPLQPGKNPFSSTHLDNELWPVSSACSSCRLKISHDIHSLKKLCIPFKDQTLFMVEYYSEPNYVFTLIKHIFCWEMADNNKYIVNWKEKLKQ
jgi:hypothetical protein